MSTLLALCSLAAKPPLAAAKPAAGAKKGAGARAAAVPAAAPAAITSSAPRDEEEEGTSSGTEATEGSGLMARLAGVQHTDLVCHS